jgi:hypothetical protein
MCLLFIGQSFIERLWASAPNRTTTKQHGPLTVKHPSMVLSGDHIAKVPPVPIPNTVVKLCEPMIVPTSAKVGIASFLNPFQVS